jgi:hypothetical protein
MDVRKPAGGGVEFKIWHFLLYPVSSKVLKKKKPSLPVSRKGCFIEVGTYYSATTSNSSSVE